MIMRVSPCDSLVSEDLKQQLSQSDYQCHNLSDELWNARNRRYRKNTGIETYIKKYKRYFIRRYI